MTEPSAPAWATVYCAEVDVYGPGSHYEVGQAVELPVAIAGEGLLADVLGPGAPRVGWILDRYPVGAVLRQLTGHVDRIRALAYRSELTGEGDGRAFTPLAGSGRLIPVVRTVTVVRPRPLHPGRTGWQPADPTAEHQGGWLIDLLDARFGEPYRASL